MRTERQQSRRPCSMASPARMMETPQIFPWKDRPLYGRPTGVVTVFSIVGRWFSPSSTSSLMMRFE